MFLGLVFALGLAMVLAFFFGIGFDFSYSLGSDLGFFFGIGVDLSYGLGLGTGFGRCRGTTCTEVPR